MPYLTLTLNGYPVDLPADAAVALSYRANDLRNLDSREAAFSETFTLPFTAQNSAVLGQPHSLDSLTDSPYRLLPAVLTSPGGVVILNGFAVLESTSEGIDITLTDALGGFFALVGESGLHELDLSAFDHAYTWANVAAADRHDYTSGYLYPLADDGRLTLRAPAMGAMFYETTLSTYLHTVLQAIVHKALPSYQLSGSLLIEETYQHVVLPRASPFLQLRQRLLDNLRASGQVEAPRLYTPVGLELYTRLQFPIEEDPGGHFFAGGSYVAPAYMVDLVVKIRLRALVRATQGFGGRTQVKMNLRDESKSGLFGIGFFDERNFYYDFVSPVLDIPVTMEYTVTLDRLIDSGPIALWMAITGGIVTLLPGSSISFEVMPRVYPGAPVHLDANLPALKQSELLELVFNQFNCIVQVDTVTKRVRLDLFNDLERNRNRARDWASKVDFTARPKLAYKLGDYAQQNSLAYDDAPEEYAQELYSTPLAAKGAAYLPVLNATLAAKAEAYKAPFLLPQPHAATISAQNLLWLPYFSAEKFPNPVQFYDPAAAYGTGSFPVLYRDDVWVSKVQVQLGVPPGPTPAPSAWELLPYEQPHTTLAPVALLTRQTTGVRIVDDAPATGVYVNTALLVRDKLSFADLLPAYYPGLINSLRRVQVLTLNVRLTALDIASLDFTIPVTLRLPHIQGYGKLSCLAYLNDIDQYVPGSPGSVACTFLVLGDPVPGLAPRVPPPVAPPLRAFVTEDAQYYLLSEAGEYILEEY